MSIVVGIDIGGSTTKIAAFKGDEMLVPVQISADNPVASLFGAFGKFLYDNNLELNAFFMNKVDDKTMEEINYTALVCIFI